MKSPPIPTSCWLFILSGIVVPVLCALSTPIGILEASNARVNPNSPALKSNLTSNDGAVALWSATPSGAFIDTCHSAIIEAGEGKPSCSLPDLAFLEPNEPPKAFSGLLPPADDSPSRIVSLPLRC